MFGREHVHQPAIPPAAFGSAAELMAHYAAIRARLGPERSRPTFVRPHAAWSTPTLTVVSVSEKGKIGDSLDLIEKISAPGAGRLPAIRYAVAKTFGCRVGDLVGPSRKAGIVRVRQIAIALAYATKADAYNGIGRAFTRHHTTVLHAVRKMGPIVEAVIAERSLNGAQ